MGFENVISVLGASISLAMLSTTTAEVLLIFPLDAWLNDPPLPTCRLPFDTLVRPE